MNYRNQIFATLSLAWGILCQAGVASEIVSTQASWQDRIVADLRLRYEMVDQDSLDDADALTYRLRLGYQSEDSDGLQYLVEGEFSNPLQSDSYDAYPGAQGAPGKAIIADGRTAELNRVQVKYTTEGFTGIVGRQRIILDNARFVGNVGWRQNEQTYDALLLGIAPVEALSIHYAYVDQVNRIFGSAADATALRRLDTDAGILNVAYQVGESSKLAAYYYDFEVNNAAAASSVTQGAYFTHDYTSDNGWKTSYRLEYAWQRDNSASPPRMNFSLNYFRAEATARKEAHSVGLAWESLEGNGRRGFSTPLATLHAFNGWADVFLTTPANGLVDWQAWFGYAFSKDISGKLVYHSYDAERSSTHYGDELDAVLSWKMDDQTKLTAKLASYNGSSTAPTALRSDRRKLWLQVDYSY